MIQMLRQQGNCTTLSGLVTQRLVPHARLRVWLYSVIITPLSLLPHAVWDTTERNSDKSKTDNNQRATHTYVQARRAPFKVSNLFIYLKWQVKWQGALTRFKTFSGSTLKAALSASYGNVMKKKKKRSKLGIHDVVEQTIKISYPPKNAHWHGKWRKWKMLLIRYKLTPCLFLSSWQQNPACEITLL